MKGREILHLFLMILHHWSMLWILESLKVVILVTITRISLMVLILMNLESQHIMVKMVTPLSML